MHPYRTAHVFTKPHTTWFGRRLCRLGWHKLFIHRIAPYAEVVDRTDTDLIIWTGPSRGMNAVVEKWPIV